MGRVLGQPGCISLTPVRTSVPGDTSRPDDSPSFGNVTGHDLFFHGTFHTPIQYEIQPGAERIALIATGTGIGPLFGYAEKTLRDGETRPITLYASFREESH